MIFDDVFKSPVLRRVVAAGEEQMGKVVGRLLSGGTVTSGMQGLVASALRARETFDRGMEHALRAANLPSRADVTALKQKLEELESMLDGLSARVGSAPDHDRAVDGDEPPRGAGKP